MQKILSTPSAPFSEVLWHPEGSLVLLSPGVLRSVVVVFEAAMEDVVDVVSIEEAVVDRVTDESVAPTEAVGITGRSGALVCETAVPEAGGTVESVVEAIEGGIGVSTISLIGHAGLHAHST